MYMRRKRRQQAEPPGEDSFLDIVANVVGILIILVMVVGARAKSAWETRTVNEQAAIKLQQLDEAAAISRKTTEALETDINQLEQKINTVKATTAIRADERAQLQYMVTAVEHELGQRRDKLNDADRSQFDLRSQIAAARDELSNLGDRRRALENTSAQTNIIEHLPTPMAKTVFGKEVHFRLRGKRIAYVPLEELIELMKTEIRFKAEKLKHSEQTSETVGPIGGFHLRYQLHLVEQVQSTDFGVLRRQVPEFAGFYLIPMREDLGEPFEQAMQTGSQFRRTIDSLNPESTTITVWVYPDSFDEFRTLKRDLFKRGFLTASWPLPDGHPISGGPDGRRSSAQ